MVSVRQCILANAYVNAITYDGYSAWNNGEMAYDGFTALMFAASNLGQSGHVDVLEVLLNHSDINVSIRVGNKSDNKSVFDLVHRGPHRDEIIYLIKYIPFNNLMKNRNLFFSTIPADIHGMIEKYAVEDTFPEPAINRLS